MILSPGAAAEGPKLGDCLEECEKTNSLVTPNLSGSLF